MSDVKRYNTEDKPAPMAPAPMAPAPMAPPPYPTPLSEPAFMEPGYEVLTGVLLRAYNQAALTKGAERHANSRPFHEQPMQGIADRRGVGFLLGQVDKKTEEAQGMAARGQIDKAVHELLGAINYLAGAVIYLERQKE